MEDYLLKETRMESALADFKGFSLSNFVLLDTWAFSNFSFLKNRQLCQNILMLTLTEMTAKIVIK